MRRVFKDKPEKNVYAFIPFFTGKRTRFPDSREWHIYCIKIKTMESIVMGE